MGKAVPKSIKLRAKKLIELMPKAFGTDFSKNKEEINKLNLPLSKKEKNLIAGYIGRLCKIGIKREKEK